MLKSAMPRSNSDLFFDELMGVRQSGATRPRRGAGPAEWVEDAEAEVPAARLIQDPKRGVAWVLPTSAAMTPAVRPASTAGKESLDENVFPPDTRQVVRDTIPIAFRFVCCLDLLFEHPKDSKQTILGRGTGTLISDRHVLTAAHNILNILPGFPDDGRRRAQRIVAAPGRNGRTLPFGESNSRRLRVAPQWDASEDHEFDFGLITLEDTIGATTFASLSGAALGFWSHPRLGGGTHIRPLELSVLRGKPVNLDGYPIDKCLDQPPNRPLNATEFAACTGTVPGNPRLRDLGSMQWRAFGNILDPSPTVMPRVLTHDLDSAVGQSGGPVWLRWEQYRNLVAVHDGGFPTATAPFTIVSNMGVRITNDVLKTVRDWMKADGVTPTF